MKRKHAFIPSGLDLLESRVVLSKTTQGLSVVVSGLSPHLKVLNRQQQAMSAEIQQAFASFQSDYDQARATYFASILNQTSPSTATTAAFTLSHLSAFLYSGKNWSTFSSSHRRGRRKPRGSPTCSRVWSRPRSSGRKDSTPGARSSNRFCKRSRRRALPRRRLRFTRSAKTTRLRPPKSRF